MKTGTLVVTPLHIRANAFDLSSRLAEDLAHEIKNPIHAAVINAELIRRRIAAQQADQALERVRILEAEVGRAHDLVDRLLRLLRPSREPETVLALDRAMADLLPLIEVLGRMSKISVRYEPGGDDVLVAVSAAALRHGMLNLVVNAIDAMRPRGGRLTIVADRGPGEVRLHVTDTGPGVDPSVIERIGTPGTTTRPDKAGLGLAVAQTLMEEVGGRIELHNAGGGGEGATFILALPRAACV